MNRVILALACSGLTAYAVPPHLAPAPGRLAPWTKALSRQQPDDAFVAGYRSGGQLLLFVAAKHANATASKTFRLIEASFAAYRFNTAILEGFSTSRGANPADLIQRVLASAPKDGFAEEGETFPAVQGAVAQGATIWGGEPDDSDVKATPAPRAWARRTCLGSTRCDRSRSGSANEKSRALPIPGSSR